MNYRSGQTDAKDIWINNIDFLEVAVNGIIGGLTAGIGPAPATAGAVTKLLQNNLNAILTISGAAINSFVSYTPNDGFTSFENGSGLEFVSNLVSSLVAATAGDIVEKSVKRATLVWKSVIGFGVSMSFGFGTSYLQDRQIKDQDQMYITYYNNQKPMYFGGDFLYPFPK